MNHLINATSPYLLQHLNNPVDWYPWCEDAFEKARREDKPIFLSIGYSTCHWCHVMADESFENDKIAKVLNSYFVCIKVDREERPDIDCVYMTVCQALTGSGGWPMSMFLTPERKPFFAGTYFPPENSRGMIGFYDLIVNISDRWKSDRQTLIKSANDIIGALSKTHKSYGVFTDEYTLLDKAAKRFLKSFDRENGGFGNAPKFPLPHNLIFLLLYGKYHKDEKFTEMATYTLMQMNKGGIYDHIGGGFSRYSTDNKFFIPHFEKMLYDNALLIIAFSVAYSFEQDEQFLNTAIECADYVLRDMTDINGGFYSAQDADAENKEGAYYVFDYEEIILVLGKEIGDAYCEFYGITERGNFEGKNLPNCLDGHIDLKKFAEEKRKLYEYRKSRMNLSLDDKILSSWNSIMIIAMTFLYRVSGKEKYICAAKRAAEFIEKNLCSGDRLFVSCRKGLRSDKSFFDDYSFYCAALLTLYLSTGERHYLERSELFVRKAHELFYDDINGGYFINGKDSERLILPVKETYDGAMPSGNSVMYYVLNYLVGIENRSIWKNLRDNLGNFLYSESFDFPEAHSMFLCSVLMKDFYLPKIVIVVQDKCESNIDFRHMPIYAEMKILNSETEEYKIINNKTTYYVCHNMSCLPPTNTLNGIFY